MDISVKTGFSVKDHLIVLICIDREKFVYHNFKYTGCFGHSCIFPLLLNY